MACLSVHLRTSYCQLPSHPCPYPQLFLQLGNGPGNHFWAANVPPSEALEPSSSPGARRYHLEAKYREGKYRRYHPLFGNQEELDKVSHGASGMLEPPCPCITP